MARPLTEPDVTLTDYALFLQSGAFAAWLWLRRPGHPLTPWAALFFAAAAASPLFGGTVHGFFLEPSSLGHRVLWPAALLSLGLTALAGCGLAARLVLPARTGDRVIRLALLVTAAYSSAVLLGVQGFGIAIASYLPAVLFMLAAFAVEARRGREGSGLGVVGMLLTLLAAGVQRGGVTLHPTWFDHNALYHVVQAAALACVFVALRRITASELATSSPHR